MAERQTSGKAHRRVYSFQLWNYQPPERRHEQPRGQGGQQTPARSCAHGQCRLVELRWNNPSRHSDRNACNLYTRLLRTVGKRWQEHDWGLGATGRFWQGTEDNTGYSRTESKERSHDRCQRVCFIPNKKQTYTLDSGESEIICREPGFRNG